MASEIVHLSYAQTNLSTSAVYFDRRVSQIAGSFTATNYFQLTKGSYDTNVDVDDAEQSVNPVSGSMVWSGSYSVLTAFGGSTSRYRVTFDNPAVQGVVVLGTQTGGYTWNTFLDTVAVDTGYGQGSISDWAYKTPIWGAKNGIGGILLPPGSHSFDAQTAGGGNFQQFYAVCGYDGKVHPRRVLILGDSFTNNARSFVWHMRNHVKMHFPHSDLHMYSFDYSARATADLLGTVSHSLTMLDLMLMAYSPTLVLYILGRNDANGTSTTASLYSVTSNSNATGVKQAWGSTHKTNMDSVLSKVQSYGAQFAWYCPVNVGPSQMHFVNGAREWAITNNVPFHDAGLVIGGNTNLISGSHPNPAGNEVLGTDMFLWFVDLFRWLI